MSRRFESGAQKRKLRKERENFQNKLPKLTEYFSSNQLNSQSNEQRHAQSDSQSNEQRHAQSVDYEKKSTENYSTCKTENEDIANKKNLNVYLHTEDTYQSNKDRIENDVYDSENEVSIEASHTNKTESLSVITTETNAGIFSQFYNYS